MITAAYCHLFARYNRWQNSSLVAAASQLTQAERWRDRGAFFGSIAGTLNHLYWADALILARIEGNERPHDTIVHNLSEPAQWADFVALRAARDRDIERWAEGLNENDLAGVVRWYPPDGSPRLEMSKSLCAAQFFNHQTHHRGQVHAMLTLAGVTPEVTDLSAMPQR
ncbi:DinB family protein [Shimia haliotis]|uniref:Uncharacterized damage-inducible protein DinB (Forms a four-helix bundle) n=1 Tax=Shimia haliotis TaxID=1280847 RepID=A0A1I4DEB1_9RHOB|nr:DinB family protein [Shimia haliotis]SFK92164.1 Uncharacterized damage-inducible protein DinB (forms a four-helix bundle) [Shimia haliotis]